MTRVPFEQRQYLERLSDQWAMQPAEWAPSAVARGLKAAGFARIKRERPVPGAPYRHYMRRTNAGRAVLGLAPIGELAE